MPMRPTRRRKADTAQPVSSSMSEYFMARLGYKPSNQPFHTTANRQCGKCHHVKPGAEFDVPITPGRPDLNTCRRCT